MHTRPTTPLPERLPIIKVPNPRQTKQRRQRHVRHDRRHEPSLHRPGRDELGETVAPDVLVDGDGNEDGAGDGLVGVDAVGRGDGGEGGDLDAGACVADYHDWLVGMLIKRVDGEGRGGDGAYLPVPLLLVSERDDEVSEDHQADVGDHRRQSHFRFSDSAVLFRCTRCDPVG